MPIVNTLLPKYLKLIKSLKPVCTKYYYMWITDGYTIQNAIVSDNVNKSAPIECDVSGWRDNFSKKQSVKPQFNDRIQLQISV